MADRQAIEAAFTHLRDEGFITRAATEDCGSCAVAAIEIEARVGGVAKDAIDSVSFAYFHQQDAEAFEVEDDGSRDCDECSGQGTVGCRDCDGEGTVEVEDDDDRSCTWCEGRGYDDCSSCDGSGRYEDEPTYGDFLRRDLYIGFGGPDALEAGRAVVAALEAEGLETDWDGNPAVRIKVKGGG